jgi:hypothetical protein
MTVTFVCNNQGCYTFKLPNGKNIGIPEKTALTIIEELR